MAIRPNQAEVPIRVFISAVEPSADLLGAELIRAISELSPTCCLVGLAGPKMLEAGCLQIDDMTDRSAMLLNAVRLAGRAWSVLRKAERTVRQTHFDAAVVIDSPALHLPMAARLHKAGLPVMYYVAPQLWAWNPRRINRIRRFVTRLAVVLPFEEEYFRGRGVDATFVGHPLFDRLRRCPPDPQKVEAIRRRVQGSGFRVQGSGLGAELRIADCGLRIADEADEHPTHSSRWAKKVDNGGAESETGADGCGPVVALLPGSRQHVVAEVFPGQIEVARAIRGAFPNAMFGVSVANAQTGAVIDRVLQATTGATGATGNSPGIAVTRCEGGHTDLIAAADLVLVASGTSTLEVAYFGKPMIVMYNASRLTVQLLGRWLVRTKYLSLPNILAGERIVPEFMPYYRDTSPIAACAVEILRDPAKGQRISADLARVVAPLAAPGAARRAAQLLLDMIEARRR